MSGTTKVEFAYDYMGRRVEKKAYSYNAGSWLLTSDSLFLYDGWNMVQELNSSAVVQKSYVWGLDLSQTLQGAGGIGGLIASIDSGTTKMYYYLYDANGNVGQLIDSSDGSLTAHYEYDPYGNITIKAGSYADQNPIRFSTKFFDNETGLGYWIYRYYSPQLGRWLNIDPFEEEGGINLYAFVENNPVNEVDPLGLFNLYDYLLSEIIIGLNIHSRMGYGGIRGLIHENNLSGQSDELITCLIYKESGFDRFAVPRDKKGNRLRCPTKQNPYMLCTARGLTQMTKSAAKEVDYDHDMMFYPNINIRAGSKYLNLRIEWAKGSIKKGLNGYGTGEGYSDGILECEKCLKNNPCKYKDCLKLVN